MDVRSGLQIPGNYRKKAGIMQFHDLFSYLKCVSGRLMGDRIQKRARRIASAKYGCSRALAPHFCSGLVDSLEDRTLLTTVLWDGGGADANWTTPQNWASDVAPWPMTNWSSHRVHYS